MTPSGTIRLLETILMKGIVIGASLSGKTTVAKLIVGILKADEGTILWW